MSQPVHDLQRLIANQRPVSGRAVAVTGGMVRVATAQGVVEVSGSGLEVGGGGSGGGTGWENLSYPEPIAGGSPSGLIHKQETPLSMGEPMFDMAVSRIGINKEISSSFLGLIQPPVRNTNQIIGLLAVAGGHGCAAKADGHVWDNF